MPESNPNPNPNPPQPAAHGTTARSSEAQTEIGAKLAELFPGGVIPEGRGSIKTAERLGLAGETPAPAPAPAPAPTPAPAPAPAPEEKKETSEASAAQKIAAKLGEKKEPDPSPAPPAPEPDKKPDTLTEEQLAAAEKNMDVKAGTAFKHVRSRNKELESELERVRTETEAKVRELEAKVGVVDEAKVKELQDRLTKYETELAITHVEATEGFQRDIAQPLAQAEKQLTDLAAKYDISPTKLYAALSNPDNAKRSDELSDLSSNFNRLDTVRFDQLTTKLEDLSIRRQQALQDASARLAEYEKNRQIEQTKAAESFKSSWTAALQTTGESLANDLPIFKKTGDPKWDAKLEEALAKVKGVDIMTVKNEEMAAAFYKAGIFPLVLQLVSDLYDENSTQAEELVKYRGATPPAGGGNPPASEQAQKPQPTTMAEALKAALPAILPP